VLLRPQKWVTSLILRFAESIALPFARVLCTNGSGGDASILNSLLISLAHRLELC